jgi:hypothetical protein
VRSNELDQHTFKRIGDTHHEAVLIAANIEDNPVVSHKVDLGSEGGLYVCWLGRRATIEVNLWTEESSE